MTGWGRLAATVVGLVLLAGCGSASDGADALGAGLDRVDAAVVARDFDAARAALDDLESEATSLAVAGDLSAADEKSLLAAVDELRASLPNDAGSPTQDPTDETSSAPSTSPTTDPTTDPPSDETDEGDSAGSPKPDDPGKGKGKENGNGKGKKDD